MRILGIMSGSSLDGIDIASVLFDGAAKWTLESYSTISIPSDLSNKLKNLISMNAFGIAEVESEYSHFMASIVNDFVESNKLNVDYLSIHGHTVLHAPKLSTSWQLLNGGLVAALTQKHVVCDFRNGDMALGGQGTPMAVIADRDLFKGYDYYVNLGGIANVSFFESGKWQAFDISPCNQVNNYFANQLGQQYDKNGELAKKGKVHNGLLNEMLNEKFIKKENPKSIDNTWIKEYWIPKMEVYALPTIDYLATFNAFLVKVIAEVVKKIGAQVFITGGGGKNLNFINDLRLSLEGKAHIDIPEEKVVDYKESILMAYMAFLRVNKVSNFIHTASGASKDVIGGCIYMS